MFQLGADSTATLMVIMRDATTIYSGAVVTSFSDVGLPPDSSKVYTVITSNSNGSSSASTSSGTEPSAPGVIAQGVSGTEIDLTISPDYNAASMQIFRDGTSIYNGALINTFPDTSLTPDTAHSYLVTTTNSVATSSTSANGTTGPSGPGIIATGNGLEIDLTLSPDSTATLMQILRNGTDIYDGGLLSTFTDASLPPDSSYTYIVNTSNSNGASSGSAGATTGPGVPTIAAQGVSGTEIDLTISPDYSAGSMVIMRDGSPIYSGGPVGSFADINLTPDATHSYIVINGNGNGSSTSDPADGTTGPANPGVTATAVSSTEIDLAIAPDYSATSMVITRSDGTVVYTGSPDGGFADQDLAPDVLYGYTVTTSNSDGFSSAYVSATTEEMNVVITVDEDTLTVGKTGQMVRVKTVNDDGQPVSVQLTVTSSNDILDLPSDQITTDATGVALIPVTCWSAGDANLTVFDSSGHCGIGEQHLANGRLMIYGAGTTTETSGGPDTTLTPMIVGDTRSFILFLADAEGNPWEGEQIRSDIADHEETEIVRTDYASLDIGSGVTATGGEDAGTVQATITAKQPFDDLGVVFNTFNVDLHAFLDVKIAAPTLVAKVNNADPPALLQLSAGQNQGFRNTASVSIQAINPNTLTPISGMTIKRVEANADPASKWGLIVTQQSNDSGNAAFTFLADAGVGADTHPIITEEFDLIDSSGDTVAIVSVQVQIVR